MAHSPSDPSALDAAPPESFQFDAEVWRHDGDAAWHFLTVPDDISDDIEEMAAGMARGFGSVRVRVHIGATTWSTSVFPDAKRRAYVLPVKKQVRRSERISAGDRVGVTLELITL